MSEELKVYISVDFEGAACVVGEAGKTLGASGQYEEARRIVTGEANAAVEGCLDAGATDILVNDAHDGGSCMIHDQMHPRARVLLGTPRPRRFLGLDDSFAGVMLLAYHPMAGVTNGVLSHSYSSVGIQHMWLNGRRIGEIGFDAACAGRLGVPAVLVSSCAEGCREAAEFLGDVETVITKWGISRNAAISLSVAEARDRIRAGARRACERVGEFEPFTVDPPLELKTEYKLESAVDGKRGGERVGPRTFVRRSDNIFDLL
ncbi:MAG: M55 family metallopeptidase [Planctomycetota bacterium]